MKRTVAILSAGLISLGALAVADGHISEKQINSAIKARKAHMQLYAFHLSTLGGMAKGDIPYDAEAASAAADSLVVLTQLPQGGYWLPGSDSESVENTRALPAIWADGSEAAQKGADMAAAALAMQASAGTGLEALQANMGALGGSCGGCHKPYRQSNN